MPFYEYQCDNCGHHLEVLQKLSDAPVKKCPSCGKSRLARIVSRVAFRLKGGGWYETDFKSDGENKRNLVGDDKPAEAGATEAAKPADAPAAAPAKDAKDTESKAPKASKARATAPKPAKARAKAAAKPARARPAKKKAARR